MGRVAVVMDLDDTLISTSKVYADLQIELMRYLQQCLHPFSIPPSVVIEVWDLIRKDPEGSFERSLEHYRKLAVDEDSQSPEGFPQRITEVFIECMLRSGVMPTREQARHVYEMGMTIFTADYLMLPGARKLIEYLSRRADTKIFILTHGSPELQKPKVAERAIFARFQEIVVLPLEISKGTSLREMQKEYEDVDTWIMVGDSVVRDINPALAEGLLAIHVKRCMEDYENARVIDIGGSRDRYFPVYDLYAAEKFLKEAVYGKEVQVKAGRGVLLHSEGAISTHANRP